MYKGKVDQFILINLGATIDFLNVDQFGDVLADENQVALISEDDLIEIFILDSHRPINLIKYGLLFTNVNNYRHISVLKESSRK